MLDSASLFIQSFTCQMPTAEVTSEGKNTYRSRLATPVVLQKSSMTTILKTRDLSAHQHADIDLIHLDNNDNNTTDNVTSQEYYSSYVTSIFKVHNIVMLSGKGSFIVTTRTTGSVSSVARSTTCVSITRTMATPIVSRALGLWSVLTFGCCTTQPTRAYQHSQSCTSGSSLGTGDTNVSVCSCHCISCPSKRSAEETSWHLPLYHQVITYKNQKGMYTKPTKTVCTSLRKKPSSFRALQRIVFRMQKNLISVRIIPHTPLQICDRLADADAHARRPANEDARSPPKVA